MIYHTSPDIYIFLQHKLLRKSKIISTDTTRNSSKTMSGNTRIIISVEAFIGWNWGIFLNNFCLVHRNLNGVDPKWRKYDKSKIEQNIFYFELSIKDNIDIIGITVSIY